MKSASFHWQRKSSFYVFCKATKFVAWAKRKPVIWTFALSQQQTAICNKRCTKVVSAKTFTTA